MKAILLILAGMSIYTTTAQARTYCGYLQGYYVCNERSYIINGRSIYVTGVYNGRVEYYDNGRVNNYDYRSYDNRDYEYRNYENRDYRNHDFRNYDYRNYDNRDYRNYEYRDYRGSTPRCGSPNTHPSHCGGY